ncbi:MAG: hypothetical protein IPK58_14895 [Acidobacteria bacterium]|nr:hypothetical protein [Acidobacteriota bacterium]
MGTNWTVEGWINPAACSDNQHCTMFARSNGNFDGLLITYLGAGHPRNNEFAFDVGNGSIWQVALNSSSKYSIGSWYHVAATKNGDTYRLYVNGVQRAEQTLAGASTQYQSRDNRLGRWNYGTDAYLNGKIDEVAVYNRALSATEIKVISDVGGYGKCAAGMTNTDLDGDMSTDLTIFRPNGATGTEWWTLRSSTGGNWAAQFGDPTDRIVAEDFTGDGKTDVAIFRPSNSNWYILRSEDYSYYSFPFGTTGDIAVLADYDGDGSPTRPSTGLRPVSGTSRGRPAASARSASASRPTSPSRPTTTATAGSTSPSTVRRTASGGSTARTKGLSSTRSAMTPTTTSPVILPATARRTSPSSGRPTTTGTSSEARTTLTIPSRSARPAISRRPATLTATPSSTPPSSVRPTANGT